MRVSALTAGVFLTTALISLVAMRPALADGCGDACDCPTVKARPKSMVTNLPAHPAPVVVHQAARPVARAHRMGAYYHYASAAAFREGGHGAWRVAPNDGQVPMLGPMIQAMPGPCCAPAPLPQPMSGPCCAPMGYGPQTAYGPPPGYYGPPENPSLHVDDRGWTGGVGANADGGGGGGGGFMDGFGQVHFAQGGGTQNGPTYNDYNQSFQPNPSVPGAFQPRLMGGLAPSK